MFRCGPARYNSLMPNLDSQAAEPADAAPVGAEPGAKPTVADLLREFEGRMDRLDGELAELRKFFDSVGAWLAQDPSPRN